jgi:hypothetical protein
MNSRNLKKKLITLKNKHCSSYSQPTLNQFNPTIFMINADAKANACSPNEG